MRDFPRRAAARSEKRFLILLIGLIRLNCNPTAATLKIDSACLQYSGNESSRNDRRHYHSKWGKERETEAADRDERRLKL